MKRCRYIYLGFDNKNNKFYFDQVSRQVYGGGQNSTSNTSKLLPYYGAACVMVYVLFRNFKIQSGIFPIEVYILVTSLIGIILAMISSIYLNRRNEEMFSQCKPYTQTEQTDWEKILSEGQKMLKLYAWLRIGIMTVAIIIAVFIKTQQNPLFLIYNIIIWWLLMFFFININVRKTTNVIKEIQQAIPSQIIKKDAQ